VDIEFTRKLFPIVTTISYRPLYVGASDGPSIIPVLLEDFLQDIQPQV
jgi:hypothetical protein